MKFPPLGVDEAGITVASLERERERGFTAKALGTLIPVDPLNLPQT